MRHFAIGFDIGSTTVKAVVVDAATDQVLWEDYQRHDTKQPEKSLEFLQRIEAEVPGFDASRTRIFVTGSGGSNIGKMLGAKFVQEVNAVSLSVEKLYPPKARSNARRCQPPQSSDPAWRSRAPRPVGECRLDFRKRQLHSGL